MNLAKSILFAYPVVLTSMLIGNAPAYASESASFSMMAQVHVAQIAVNHLNLAASNLRSDPPRLPTGCGWARCIKAEQWLQSRLPGF